MKRILYKFAKVIQIRCNLFVLILVLVPFTSVFSQTIKASINKNRILIGEQAELVIETAAATPLFVTIDTIPHFEIAGFPRIDTIEKDNKVIVKGIYTITSFDSGRWSIPSFAIDGAAKTDSIPVDVVFSEFDPNQDYHDIKDIIETKQAAEKIPWWWIAAGAIVIGIIIFYLIKKKKQPVRQAASRHALSAYDEAMQSLLALRQHKPAAKVYYSSLADIFRVYIFKTKKIRSMQKTTDDLIVQLALTGLPKPSFDELAQVLRLSDFVKFAKYPATPEDDEHAFSVIRSSIEQIEKTTVREGGAAT